MNPSDASRRSTAKFIFDGVDITTSVQSNLLSVTYTDNEEDETDDLQIRLQDRDGIWLEKWLNDAVESAVSSDGLKNQLKIQAIFTQKNWYGNGGEASLDCGVFELDSIDARGPPAVIAIKATSLPYSGQFRQTKKSKAWENLPLSAIAAEMAAENGMVCMYESANNPSYKRVEQYKESDIAFLSSLCHDAGISLKVTNQIIVLFDQSTYERKSTVATIARGDGKYTKYKLSTGTADAEYASCRVSYADPGTGECIEGVAKVEDYNADAKNNQQLEITAKVASVGEAKALAEKMLRLHNKFAKTASFTLHGDPSLVAGVTVMLEKWGAWNGKYIVRQAKHTIDGSGYTVQVKLRKVLEGY
ncbi:MAG: hypothetical protein IJ955_02435 [Oscillospiraceae bacterium]|nr:hypothetical protein [Oscillospiraceae bacterium]